MLMLMALLVLMVLLMLRLKLVVLLMVLRTLNTINIVNSTVFNGNCGRSLMFVPFSGARAKGIGFDCTRWFVTFSGGSGRDKGWKE